MSEAGGWVGSTGHARIAFADAAGWFLALVRSVPPDGWDEAGLGEWSVRELVGHTARAFTTVELYLDPSAEVVVADAAQYFGIALAAEGVHEAVAERGRQAGAALGADPAAAVEEAVERVLALIERTPGDTPCATAAGGMRLDDYLSTRVMELTLHGLDLSAAIGDEVAPPESAVRVTLGVLASVASSRPDVGVALRALTGRGAPPAGWSLLA